MIINILVFALTLIGIYMMSRYFGTENPFSQLIYILKTIRDDNSSGNSSSIIGEISYGLAIVFMAVMVFAALFPSSKVHGLYSGNELILSFIVSVSISVATVLFIHSRVVRVE